MSHFTHKIGLSSPASLLHQACPYWIGFGLSKNIQVVKDNNQLYKVMESSKLKHHQFFCARACLFYGPLKLSKQLILFNISDTSNEVTGPAKASVGFASNSLDEQMTNTQPIQPILHAGFASLWIFFQTQRAIQPLFQGHMQTSFSCTPLQLAALRQLFLVT